MNILISGGTGFIGKKLRNNAMRKGHTVRLINREDFQNSELLLDKVQWSSMIVNLAGATISKRWTEAYKKEIYHSRIDTTKAIVEAIQKANKKPKLFISVSATSIYSSTKIQTEEDCQLADDFLAQVCVDWEKVAQRAAKDTRVVIFRLGVVLGRNGGIVKQLTPLFKFGLGAKMDSGEQMMSWVHIDDVVNAFFYAVKNQSMSGIYNLTAPTPVSNRDFTLALAKAMHRKAWLTIPGFMLKWFKGEQSSIIIEEKYALPKRLMEADFNFRNDTVQAAFKQIFRKRERVEKTASAHPDPNAPAPPKSVPE
jgi:uncharacterized protein